MSTRLRYFANQVLGVADFETEQRYLIGGLQVSVGAHEVVVAPGLALDCRART